jgi:hypothetical protein
MKDFPSLAWFTTQITVPASIVKSVMRLVDNDTGEIRDLDLDPMIANSIALNRVAIGVSVASIPVMPWSNHPGYTTAEEELNESAIEAGEIPFTGTSYPSRWTCSSPRRYGAL